MVILISNNFNGIKIYLKMRIVKIVCIIIKCKDGQLINENIILYLNLHK